MKLDAQKLSEIRAAAKSATEQAEQFISDHPDCALEADYYAVTLEMHEKGGATCKIKGQVVFVGKSTQGKY